MRASLDEVERVTVAEGIDARLVRGGSLTVARTPAQLERVQAHVSAERQEPGGDHDTVLLDAAEVASRVQVAGALGGSFTPHCARIHPARLVRGLAEAARKSRRADFRIDPGVGNQLTRGHARERRRCQSRQDHPGDGGVHRPFARASPYVAADELVDDRHRTSAFPRVGRDRLGGTETLADGAHAYCYAQRTSDGRIAIGGRGVPYRFGSRTDSDGETAPQTVEDLTRLLHNMFPAAREVPIAHAWSGVLGVPRDWCATVGLDRTTGLGWAGGYVGDGVTTSNLAGRTL